MVVWLVAFPLFTQADPRSTLPLAHSFMDNFSLFHLFKKRKLLIDTIEWALNSGKQPPGGLPKISVVKKLTVLTCPQLFTMDIKQQIEEIK